jgi:hypothetical protein
VEFPVLTEEVLATEALRLNVPDAHGWKLPFGVRDDAVERSCPTSTQSSAD